MRNRAAAAALLAAASCLLPSVGNSEPPPAGRVAVFQEAIVCDTRAEIEALAAAWRAARYATLIPKYIELNARRDDRGEPECAIQPLGPVRIVGATFLGTSHNLSGRGLRLWAVEAGAERHVFLLYVEPDAAAGRHADGRIGI